MKRPAQAPKPWQPFTDYEEADTNALKALATGTANDGQQTRALDFIVNRLCGTYDLSYRPESDRDTAFAEGKRFVGLQIVKHLKLATLAKTDK